MNRLIIAVNDNLSTVSLDDPAQDADRAWGVIGLRLVDELTDRPPQTAVTIATPYAGLSPRVAGDGVVGFSGNPRILFPALGTQGYDVEITLRARGYVKRQWVETLAIQPGFPGAFAPYWLPDLKLHRLPVVIQGRVVLAGTNATAPIPGAVVRITGIWRTPPPSYASMPADPPNLVCLDPPLYAEHKAGIGHLERCDLAPVMGDDKQLLESQPAGTRVIRLLNRHNLNPGDLLMLDADTPDRSEYLPVQSLIGGSTPDQETAVTLGHPTALEHRKHAVVRRTGVSSIGLAVLLSDDAIAGDETVFPVSLGALASAPFVRLGGGSAVPEYHRLKPFTATGDSYGYFRLPPLSRTAWVELEAEDGVHTPKKIEVGPDYGQPENNMDFVLG